MARGLTHVVNSANIGVIERRRGARLALETFPRSLSRKGLRQNLNRYVAMEPRVACLIHLAHATLADGGKDLIGAEPLACQERHDLSSLSRRPGKSFVPPVAGREHLGSAPVNHVVRLSGHEGMAGTAPSRVFKALRTAVVLARGLAAVGPPDVI